MPTIDATIQMIMTELGAGCGHRSRNDGRRALRSLLEGASPGQMPSGRELPKWESTWRRPKVGSVATLVGWFSDRPPRTLHPFPAISGSEARRSARG